MGWIFATIVLLVIVFVPIVRNIALLLIAVIAVFIVIDIVDVNKKEKAKEAGEAAQNVILSSQQAEREKANVFRLSDVTLSETTLDVRNSGTFSGRIHNNSNENALGSLALKLSISDCENFDQSDCVVIAERKIYLSTPVPSGQARDFTKDLNFFPSPLVIRKYMKFDTTIVQASQ